MPTLQVNSATIARQCYRVFGPRDCTRRENGTARPLKNPIRHVCSVWIRKSEGYAHTVHVCRRCGHREAVSHGR